MLIIPFTGQGDCGPTAVFDDNGKNDYYYYYYDDQNKIKYAKMETNDKQVDIIGKSRENVTKGTA